MILNFFISSKSFARQINFDQKNLRKNEKTSNFFANYLPNLLFGLPVESGFGPFLASSLLKHNPHDDGFGAGTMSEHRTLSKKHILS